MRFVWENKRNVTPTKIWFESPGVHRAEPEGSSDALALPSRHSRRPLVAEQNSPAVSTLLLSR